jgi:hypothetical protein
MRGSRNLLADFGQFIGELVFTCARNIDPQRSMRQNTSEQIAAGAEEHGLSQAAKTLCLA